jgi:hypothetical protein
VVAVSLLNGPDPPPHFKQQILLSGFNMLLASFTLHKVQNYFSGFGLRRKEDITCFSLEACDPPKLGWRDTDG